MTDIENGKINGELKTCKKDCRKVKKASIHPDFDPETKMPDLAILKLKNGFSIYKKWPQNMLEFPSIFSTMDHKNFHGAREFFYIKIQNVMIIDMCY